MFSKCAVENVGTAARCADNEYWTNNFLTHNDLPLDPVYCILELYDIFIHYLQAMSTGLVSV